MTMKHLESLSPFTEISGKEFSGSFHRDPGGRLFLLVDTPPEGVRDLIDAPLSLGGMKSGPDTVRLVLTLHRDGTPLLLLDKSITLSRDQEDYRAFLSAEMQSLAFFYSSEGKRFFILAKQVRLDEKLKAELLAMAAPGSPVIHRIPLSQTDITPFLKASYKLYRFEEEALEDPSLMMRVENGALLKRPFSLWTGRDPGGAFLLSDTPLQSRTPEKKGCHPLEMTALPYGFSTVPGILFRILIDKEGMDDLKARGDRKKYEESYPFWH